MAFTESEWELVRARMEAFPEHLRIAILNTSFSKDELLLHIDKRDDIGERIAAVQLNYIRKLKTGI